MIQSEAIITSPGYPNTDYPKDLNCEKVIRFNERIPIRIEFLGDFQMYDYRDCYYDFIEIRNGEDKDAPFILKACGNEKPQQQTLLGNSVWMRFESFYERKGFSIQISKLTSTEGNYCT